jgi:prepilin peptidase CpaA
MTAWPTLLLLGLFPAALIVAALRDLTSFTIPNWISLAAVAAFAPAAVAAHPPFSVLLVSIGVGVAALVLGMGLFALGWIGGGDAKLFAASALWLGWPAVLPFLVWTAVAGGLLALALLWTRPLAPHRVFGGPAWFGRLMEPKGDVPYGLAICAGALLAFPASALLHG